MSTCISVLAAGGSTHLPVPTGAPSRDEARQVFERLYPELCRAATRACRDPETAEDLVQEALLRLMVEIDAGRTPGNVRAWLHRVISNLAVSLGRHATVSRKFAPALVCRDEPATPEAIVMGIELRSDISSALETLPREARTALLLAASGYSGAEIAAALGRTDCATRTMMSRARFRLRDRLGADAAGGGIPAPHVGAAA